MDAATASPLTSGVEVADDLAERATRAASDNTSGAGPRRTRWIAALLTVYLTTEMAQVGVPLRDLGVPSPWLVSTAAGLATVGLGIAVGKRRLPGSVLYACLGLFVWTRGLSVLSAIDPQVSGSPLAQLLKDSITVVVVATLGTWIGRRLVTSMSLVVLSTAAITALAVAQQFVLGIDNELFGFSLVRDDFDIGASTVRFQGPLSDPNFWARVLVALLPFAVAAIATHRSLGRLIFAGAASSMVLGIFLTQSRAGFVAAGLVVIAVLAIAGGRARRLLAIAPVVVGVLLINPATGPRLATLIDLTKQSEDVTDLSIAYREAAQQGGLEMFRDHPLTGVGVGNFDTALLPYLRNGVTDLPPNARYAEIAPHNTYLEMAAESGIAGLIGYVVLFAGALALATIAAVRARRMPPEHRDALRWRWFTAALVASLGGWALMSVSLHIAQTRTLFALFGLSAAAANVSRSLPSRSLQRQLRWSIVRGDVLRTALAVGISAAAILALPVQAQGWERTVTMLVEVDEPAPDRFVYLQNFAVRSVAWRRTLAEVTTGEQVRERLGADLGPRSDELTITPTARRFNSTIDYRLNGPDPAVLDTATAALSNRAVQAVDELGVPFSLRPLPAPSAIEVTRINPLLLSLAILLPLLAVFQSWSQLAARRRRFTNAYGRFRSALEAQRPPDL
jgi:O-antigen ligase